MSKLRLLYKNVQFMELTKCAVYVIILIKSDSDNCCILEKERICTHMKSTTDNRSTRKTKNAIENAFIELLQKKSIDKIKISEIVDKANVNRSTFYFHYFDVYDLLDSIENKLINELCDFNSIDLQNLMHKKETYNIVSTLEYIQKNKNIINTLMNSERGMQFYNKLADILREKSLSDLIEAANDEYNSSFYEKAILFFVGGAMALVKDWLDNDTNTYSPSQLAAVIENIVTLIMSGNLQL